MRGKGGHINYLLTMSAGRKATTNGPFQPMSPTSLNPVLDRIKSCQDLIAVPDGRQPLNIEENDSDALTVTTIEDDLI